MVAGLIADGVVETGGIALTRSCDEDGKRASIRELDHFRTRPFRRMLQEDLLSYRHRLCIDTTGSAEAAHIRRAHVVALVGDFILAQAGICLLVSVIQRQSIAILLRDDVVEELHLRLSGIVAPALLDLRDIHIHAEEDEVEAEAAGRVQDDAIWIAGDIVLHQLQLHLHTDIAARTQYAAQTGAHLHLRLHDRIQLDQEITSREDVLYISAVGVKIAFAKRRLTVRTDAAHREIDLDTTGQIQEAWHIPDHRIEGFRCIHGTADGDGGRREHILVLHRIQQEFEAEVKHHTHIDVTLCLRHTRLFILRFRKFLSTKLFFHRLPYLIVIEISYFLIRKLFVVPHSFKDLIRTCTGIGCILTGCSCFLFQLTVFLGGLIKGLCSVGLLLIRHRRAVLQHHIEVDVQRVTALVRIVETREVQDTTLCGALRRAQKRNVYIAHLPVDIKFLRCDLLVLHIAHETGVDHRIVDRDRLCCIAHRHTALFLIHDLHCDPVTVVQIREHRRNLRREDIRAFHCRPALVIRG